MLETLKFKTIRDTLLNNTFNYPHNDEPVEVLKIGTFIIRCIPNRENILTIAAKYKIYKIGESVIDNLSVIKPRPASQYYNELCEADEYHDAVNFWLLRHDMPFFGAGSKGVPIPLHKAREFETGFVVSRSLGIKGYDVTHLDTGKKCSSYASNPTLSIKLFNNIPKDKLSEAIKHSTSGYQKIGIEYYEK